MPARGGSGLRMEIGERSERPIKRSAGDRPSSAWLGVERYWRSVD